MSSKIWTKFMQFWQIVISSRAIALKSLLLSIVAPSIVACCSALARFANLQALFWLSICSLEPDGLVWDSLLKHTTFPSHHEPTRVQQPGWYATSLPGQQTARSATGTWSTESVTASAASSTITAPTSVSAATSQYPIAAGKAALPEE